MSDEKETIEVIVTGTLLGTIAAAITALLTKDEKPMQKIRNFIAGALLSFLVSFISRNSNLSDTWREIIIILSGAFVSSFWPSLEIFVKKYINKKQNELLNNHNMDKP